MSRGHIADRGDGKWRLYVYAGTDTITGKQRQITKVVRGSRRDAERALTKLLGEVDGGAHTGGDVTFGQVLDAFLTHKVLSVQPTTLDTYRASIGYVTDHLRDLPVRKLTVAHLEQLYAWLLTKGRRRDSGPAGLGYSAVGNVHAAIGNALELARRRGWVAVNVARDADVPRGPKRRPTPTDRNLLPVLLAEATQIDPRLAVFIRASICAGTRRSEMHGLRWSSIDFDRLTLTLADVVVRAGGQWLVKEGTKDGGPGRTMYIDRGTADMLRAMHDEAFETAAACGIVLPRSGFVFSDEPDGNMSWKPATTARRFTRAAVAAGLPAATRIHDLRALCGTHLVDQGVPIPVVGQRLGHTLNSTTADIYVARLAESDRLAAEVMGKLLDG